MIYIYMTRLFLLFDQFIIMPVLKIQIILNSYFFMHLNELQLNN